jgi:hypothetical protein
MVFGRTVLFYLNKKAKFPEPMGRFGVDCALKRRLRQSGQRRNEGRHVDLALYARMWGRRLFERRSHSDGARRAAPAAVAKSNLAGGRPRAARLCFVHDRRLPRAIGVSLTPMPALCPTAAGDCPFAQIIVS